MDMNMRIRQYIEERGLKFGPIAEKSGMDLQKLSRFMTGKQRLTVEDYEKICRDGLSVDPAFFYDQKFLETQNVTA